MTEPKPRLKPKRRRRLKNPKAKGSRCEHKSMALLEEQGYFVTKSGASLGVWDLVAIGPVDMVVVQVKSNAWPGIPEMEALRRFQCPPNCKKLVHRWRDWQREPDVREVAANPDRDPATVRLSEVFGAEPGLDPIVIPE
jgi:hypothetical protein